MPRIPDPPGSRPGLKRTHAHKPQLAERNPVMLEAENLVADILNDWMVRHCVTNTELAERWNISESIVRGLRYRKSPLRAAHLVLLPQRAKSELFALLERAKLKTTAA